MEKKEFRAIFEWRIENFRDWCKDVHGKCIDSPTFSSKYFTKMELYPRGLKGYEENMTVRIHDIEKNSCGELAFFGPDGSLIRAQRWVSPEKVTKVLVLRGENYELVLAEVKKNGDHLTLRFYVQSDENYEKSMCTRLNVVKMSLKMDERLIGCMEREYIKSIAFIPISQDNCEGLLLKASRKHETLQLLLELVNKKRNAVLVQSCMSLLKKGSSLNIHEVKEHVFRYNTSWTLSDSLKMKDLLEKSITLLLSFKIINGSVTKSYRHLLYEYEGVSIVPHNNTYNDLTPDQSLTRELMGLYKSRDFSDVQLKCGTVSFPAHRAILSARSPVLNDMLSAETSEPACSSVLVIQDLDSATLSHLLVFLYTGTVTIDDLEWESALMLYYAAQKYQVPTLRRKCSALLGKIVSLSNVCDVLSIAEKHQDPELASSAHDFILKNYNDVLRSKEWKAFMKREPLLAVETVTHFGEKNCVGKCEPQ